jgi:phage-related protein
MYSGRIGAPDRLVGSSRRDLRGFPRKVRRDIGQALYAAQQGETDPSAKPLRGFGGGSVLEIVADYSGNTWRGLYGPIFRSDLRSARFPEEIEERDRDAEAGL